MTSENELVFRSDLKITNFGISFDCLYRDTYHFIFDYLTQQELLDLLLLNHAFYDNIMKYIPKLYRLRLKECLDLINACDLNHIITVKLNTIVYFEDWWEYGLSGACQGGHKKLIKLMLKRGARNWTYALEGACRGGIREFVDLCIKHGAGDFNGGLFWASMYGHIEIVKLMIDKGADNWNRGLENACQNGHKEIVKLMIKKGANCCNHCSKPMTAH